MLLVALPAAAVIGFITGRRRRTALLAADKEVDHVIGETTLGAILALLGLLLAFSFSNALNIASKDKSALIGEAAALGTAYLRADYLSEPGRTDLKTALLDYARTRILPGDGSASSLEGAQAFLAVTLDAQGKLWPITLEATADPTPPPIKSFVASAVNDAIDAHLLRIETLSTPVSEITQAMMLAAALLGLFLLGNRAGLVGRDLTWRTFAFSGFLFIVMITITDTLRGNEGYITLDDTALRTTIFDMEQGLAN